MDSAGSFFTYKYIQVTCSFQVKQAIEKLKKWVTQKYTGYVHTLV